MWSETWRKALTNVSRGNIAHQKCSIHHQGINNIICMKSSLAIKNIFYCCSLYCLVIINILSSSEADQQCSSMLLLTYEQYRVGELWSKVQSIRISSLTSTFIPQPFISCPVWIFSFWISHSVMWIADMYHYSPPQKSNDLLSSGTAVLPGSGIIIFWLCFNHTWIIKTSMQNNLNKLPIWSCN